MQYMLLIHTDETPFATTSPEVQRDKMSAPYAAYNEALIKAGALLVGRTAAPSATARPRSRSATTRREVLDGPFADTKEQLAGFYIVEAADMDAAIKWAARCPGAAHGTIEVRPVWPMQADAGSERGRRRGGRG